MNSPDRLPPRRRDALDRRRHAIRPLIEPLEQRLQPSLVAFITDQPPSGTYNQDAPSVAMDAAGDYVVAWTDQENSSGLETTIEAEVFNPNGLVKKAAFFVDPANTLNGNVEYSPSVAMDANGDFVVAWVDSPKPGPNGIYYYEINAQRFNLAGTAVGGQLQEVNGALTTVDTQVEDPKVAMNTSSFVIGWSQLGTPASNDTIDARRYTFSGSSNTATSPSFVVSTGSGVNSPSVAMDTAGDFIFLWDGTNGAKTTVSAQGYNASGVAQQGAALSIDAAASPFNGSVAMNGAGDFVIAFQITTSLGNDQVYAHQYALTGSESSLSFNSLSGVADVPVYAQTGTFYQGSPSAAIDAQGFATISWLEYENLPNVSNDDAVEARRLNPDGSTIESSPITVAPASTSEDLMDPRVGVGALGNAAFAWQVNSATNPKTGPDKIADQLDLYRNDAPTIATPAGQKIAENGSATVSLSGITAGSVTGGGTEEQALTVTASSSNTALIVPTVTYTSPNSTGILNLNPVAGQFGTATITVTVMDSGGTANGGVNTTSVQFTLTVVGTPTANAQSVTVQISTAKAITLTGSDPDNPALALAYKVTGGPSHGTLTGTAPNLTYTPNAGYQGTDSFTFTDSNGTVTSSPATVSINVVAGTPTANAQTVAVAHDSPGTPITLTGSDPDSPPLALTYTFAQPSHGAVTVSGTIGSPTVVYTPAAGYHGTDSFTFTASNGTNASAPATVTLNVAVGTAIANPQTVAVAHDTATTITLTSTDDDNPALTQSYSFNAPSHGSLKVSGLAGSPTVIYTPTAGYQGTDSFTFAAVNVAGKGPLATVTLNVAAGTPTANAQTASTAQATAVTITLTGTDDDSPALPLTYAIVAGQGPSHGSITGFNASSGALTYTPAAGYSGVDSFQFTVSNGTNTSSPATVGLNVTAPAQATVGGTVGVTWGAAGTATLQTNADGLRLLPAGRSTDLPWLGINTLSITLSQPETLLPSDVSVTGLTVANYGPVTVSGSGTSYTITLLQPINAADRVTLTIGNANIATYTRRLDVLPGDVNDDGVVTSADVGQALANVGLVFLFADIEGDGTVTTADVRKTRSLNGTSLPPLT